MADINWPALAEPFPAGANKFKVQATSRDSEKSMAVFYIDARDVMDRLDAVAGPAGWRDEYKVIQTQPWVVQCRLTVAGVTKCDVGEGDAPKDAYSDALKRAAVKFGVARYLYAAPRVWAESERRGNATVFTQAGEQRVRQVLASYLQRIGVEAGARDVAAHSAEEAGDVPSDDPADGVPERLFNELDDLGSQIYAERWPQVRRRNVERISDGRTHAAGDLGRAEIERLIEGLRTLQHQRHNGTERQAA